MEPDPGVRKIRIVFTEVGRLDGIDLSQCSECFAVVPLENFAEHCDWHGTLLHAHPDTVAKSRRERN